MNKLRLLGNYKNTWAKAMKNAKFLPSMKTFSPLPKYLSMNKLKPWQQTKLKTD